MERKIDDNLRERIRQALGNINAVRGKGILLPTTMRISADLTGGTVKRKLSDGKEEIRPFRLRPYDDTGRVGRVSFCRSRQSV